jgi:thiol-disulfide isomerase/thioredoxin
MCACASAPPRPAPPPSQPTPLLGQELPAFRRRTVSGERVDTAALRGKIVVVDFFSEYCAPCQRTLPELQAWHRRNADVMVVGIALDEELQDAIDQVSRYGLTFPVIHDSGGVLGGRFRVSTMPITFVADATGRLVWAGGGEGGVAALDLAVEAAR